MAATFAWGEAHGATYNASVTTPTDCNWKNIDDSTTAYTTVPVVAGTNSYTKYQFGILSGTWNQILNGKWAHTAGALSSMTLIGAPSGASQLTFAQPAIATAAASLTVDMTATTAIGSGTVVYFGPTSPNQAAKTASVLVGGGNPVYTNYLATQLQVAGGASAGDTASITVTLSYDEN